ncbi:MAG: hypothetical protein C4539_09615 [Ignavibacteriales bacterium]|nr:MAG: hypothetical protein C4539_09615 [Ignavibacteriales bacterium]
MNKIGLKIFLLALFFSLAFQTYAKEKITDNNSLNKVNTNDFYAYIAINQCFLWVSNAGSGANDPVSGNGGFFWPGGENATISAIFQDGLIWGGKIGREIRVNGNTHRLGLQAGKILDNGQADDPSLAKYRVFKIRKTWESLPPGSLRDAYKKDLEEWPVEDGAPWVDQNGNGTYDIGEAEFIGDEVLWYVANDLDPTRSTRTYGSQPIGLEQQCTLFGFNRTGDLGDILFKKYKMINKSSNILNEMYFGMWSDTDLGDANDDYTGCDTILSLGYTYNGDNNDAGYYGANPPSVGYDFFQGPIIPYDPEQYPIITEKNLPDSAKFLGKWIKGKTNLPMTAFVFYAQGFWITDPPQGQYSGTIQFYNFLQGLIGINGEPFVDPITNQNSKYVINGDPVTKTGWYEGGGYPGGPDPGDRRHLMCSGPFTMAPGDTQEIVVGIVIARGSNNLNSITELKRKDRAAQIAYDLDFQLTDAPPQPKVHTLAQDRAVTLWWEQNAEEYQGTDPLLPDVIRLELLEKDTVITVTNKDYKFEGYRVWQFSDMAGSDPKLLAVYDIKNGISDIYNFQDEFREVNGQINPTILIQAPDDGIRRFINITSSAYTNGPFYNGNPYYFGVTAYGYSKYSDPPYLESTPVIVEVRPETKKIDYTSPYQDGSLVYGDHTAGFGDGKIIFKITDPQSLTGDHYKVVMKGIDLSTTDPLRYDFINTTKNDTLLKDSQVFVKYDALEDTINLPVYEGFQLFVENIGRDSIRATAAASAKIKSVLEVKGPGGTTLAQPFDVMSGLNSTGKWMIKPKGSLKNLIWQDKASDQGFGYVDYEIVFGPTSGYYTSGYRPSFKPVLADDSLGQGTVPFQIWNRGIDPNSAADDTLLTVKIVDYDRGDSTRAVKDHLWTRLVGTQFGTNEGDWEEVYGYYSGYDPANLPITSKKSDTKTHRFGALSFSGEVPEAGTVIRLTSYKPLSAGDVYEKTLTAADFKDLNAAKVNMDKISVFPNPYFGANSLERDKYQRFVRFTNLPTDVTVRIYSLAGIFIRKLDKSDNTQWLDWDLRNSDGLPVSSGMYIAYLDMPGVGNKTLKLAVILETQYIDRL